MRAYLEGKGIEIAVLMLDGRMVYGDHYDDMSLDFFLEHIDLVAPLLSKLYARILITGKMTPTMCRAILSPLYKTRAPHTTEPCIGRCLSPPSPTGS